MKLYKHTYEGLLKLMNERDFCKREERIGSSVFKSVPAVSPSGGRTSSFKVYILTWPKSVHVYHDSLCFEHLMTVNNCNKLQVPQSWKSKHFYWTICILPINIIKYSILLNNRAKTVDI